MRAFDSPVEGAETRRGPPVARVFSTAVMVGDITPTDCVSDCGNAGAFLRSRAVAAVAVMRDSTVVVLIANRIPFSKWGW